jgi:hypothetical protein
VAGDQSFAVNLIEIGEVRIEHHLCPRRITIARLTRRDIAVARERFVLVMARSAAIAVPLSDARPIHAARNVLFGYLDDQAP